MYSREGGGSRCSGPDSSGWRGRHPPAPAGAPARLWRRLFEERIRGERFQTAQRQGFAVGRAMAGAEAPFAEAPWFWSDQYEINLQYAGAGVPWDETVIRGTMGLPPFSVFYLRRGSTIAGAGVHDPHTAAPPRPRTG